MKILLSASAPSSVPPAATFSVFDSSSLTMIETSPAATSFLRAPSSTPTSSSTTPVNITTARTMSSMRTGPYSWIPENIMNASDISPAVMKVIPRPFRPSGTCEYVIFSRIAAIATIAIAQPTPEPTPKTTLSANE